MNELKISVSGKEIYKAIANYLKNNNSLQELVKEKTNEVLTSDLMLRVIQKRIEQEFSNWSVKEMIKGEIRMSLAKEIQNYLTDDKIDKIIRQTFSKFIINEKI